MDKFLYEEDYSLVRRQWRDYSHGGYLGVCGQDFILLSRGREENRTAWMTRPLIDTVTLTPTHNQHLTAEDKHDSILDSYNQQQFRGIISDKHLMPEERIADLSIDLPTMPLNNGLYLRLA